LLQEILERIAGEAQRAGDIIHRLRAFARKEDRQTEVIDVTAAIEHVVALLDHDASTQGVDLLVSPAMNLPVVNGDRIQIEQVLVNLLRNAFDAVTANGAGEHDKRVSIRSGMNDDGELHIEVSDTGCGVTEDSEPKLFDAFYTTKKEGLGMGLAISRTIVEAHGGRIWMTRNAERGVTAHVTLPPGALPLTTPVHQAQA
jgi:C4-dicarboxylate-specific signal transduction histidine kinase